VAYEYAERNFALVHELHRYAAAKAAWKTIEYALSPSGYSDDERYLKCWLLI